MSTKVGTIGAGGMMQYHAAGFIQGGAEIVAVADMNLEAAQRAAKQYEAQAFDDVAKMLSEGGVDAVSIITPNKFHKPLVVQALEAGKHAFCEKPPALNAAEVVEMKSAAEVADKVLMFNFNNRARPESYAMMKYIQDGDVGTINSAQCQWIRRTGIPGFGAGSLTNTFPAAARSSTSSTCSTSASSLWGTRSQSGSLPRLLMISSRIKASRAGASLMSPMV